MAEKLVAIENNERRLARARVGAADLAKYPGWLVGDVQPEDRFIRDPFAIHSEGRGAICADCARSLPRDDNGVPMATVRPRTASFHIGQGGWLAIQLLNGWDSGDQAERESKPTTSSPSHAVTQPELRRSFAAGAASERRRVAKLLRSMGDTPISPLELGRKLAVGAFDDGIV